MKLTALELAYTLTWIGISLGTAGILCIRRPEISLLDRSYRTFLLVRWKIVTFGIAGTALTAMGPLTHDPT